MARKTVGGREMMTRIEKIGSVVMVTEPHSIRFENDPDGSETVIVPVTHDLMNLLKKKVP